MGDKKDEEKPKKNPPPTARSVKRRKKKGPAASVKIPQGMSYGIQPPLKTRRSFLPHSHSIACLRVLQTSHTFTLVPSYLRTLIRSYTRTLIHSYPHTLVLSYARTPSPSHPYPLNPPPPPPHPTPPTVFPTSKCKLRLLKLERIKDYLLMEQEFIQNQELRKPREEQKDVSYDL
jgi:hypothetical protein